MKTLFFHETGPLIQYGDGVLRIADLNPEIETRWRMSRWELLRLGLAAIARALLKD